VNDKRKFPRYTCKIKTQFEYHEGNPHEADRDISIPQKAKGHIFDLSQGGAFIVTHERVPVTQPIKLYFSTRNKKYQTEGRIIRTGMLKDNPSETAQEFMKHVKKGDFYIACEFIEPISDLTPDEL
jgi:hypothetical protein